MATISDFILSSIAIRKLALMRVDAKATLKVALCVATSSSARVVELIVGIGQIGTWTNFEIRTGYCRFLIAYHEAGKTVLADLELADGEPVFLDGATPPPSLLQPLTTNQVASRQ